MLTNIIYLAVFIILAFVLSIAVKAITRGVEAKQIIKEEKRYQANKVTYQVWKIDQINELKNLHEILSDKDSKELKEKY